MCSTFPSLSATGIIITTIGVLLRKAEEAAVKAARPAKTRRGRCSMSRVRKRVKASSAPVRRSAPETMNMAPMVTGAGFENTASRSSTGRMPTASRTAAPQMATTSGG